MRIKWLSWRVIFQLQFLIKRDIDTYMYLYGIKRNVVYNNLFDFVLSTLTCIHISIAAIAIKSALQAFMTSRIIARDRLRIRTALLLYIFLSFHTLIHFYFNFLIFLINYVNNSIRVHV